VTGRTGDEMELRKAKRHMRKATSTDAGMTRLLNDLLGPGNYVYDPSQDVWVAPNVRHTGPGRSFTVIRRGGSWFNVTIPESEIS
jgi:hypothetical protein